MRRRWSGHGHDRRAPQLTSESPADAVYGATSRRWTAITGIAFLTLVFPGGFVFFLGATLTDGKWERMAAGLWTLLWAAIGFLAVWVRREFRIVDGRLAVRSAFRAREVAGAEIVDIRPARFAFPGVVVLATHGRVHRLWGPEGLAAFTAAVVAVAPQASCSVPEGGKWLRRRKAIWFVFWFVGEAAEV